VKRVAILGSTGSIGTQAIEVVRANPDRLRVVALAAGWNSRLLSAQASEFHPEVVALRAEDPSLAGSLPTGTRLVVGDEGVLELAAWPSADVVLNALTGSAGLRPTLTALTAGKSVALANKESLIVGGDLVTRLVAGRPGKLIPVDSEHSALAQCLASGRISEVSRLIVTASGGPFRGWSRERLERVTVEQALDHPTWRMGKVITVNSATLMNKGLEVIEAHYLFDLPYESIEVVVHPQSVVHGMVEFRDGSTIAQMSRPDMRLPIQLALGLPERFPEGVAKLDWTRARTLEFEPLDRETFPSVDLAVQAGRRGGTCPAVMNAANEEAVGAFLKGRLSFLAITEVVRQTVEAHEDVSAPDLDAIETAEVWARREARALIARLSGDSNGKD